MDIWDCRSKYPSCPVLASNKAFSPANLSGVGALLASGYRVSAYCIDVNIGPMHPRIPRFVSLNPWTQPVSNKPDRPIEKFKEATQSSRESAISEPERTLWKGRYTAKTMIGTWLGLVIVSIVVPLVLAFSPFRGQSYVWMIFSVLLFTGWLWAAGIAAVRILGDHYELTSQRLKHRTGILFRKVHRIELIDIDDVMFEQGPVQAMLGLGAINLRSSDSSHPELCLRGIDEVRRVADIIDDARREERRKRGLHIESV